MVVNLCRAKFEKWRENKYHPNEQNGKNMYGQFDCKCEKGKQIPYKLEKEKSSKP